MRREKVRWEDEVRLMRGLTAQPDPARQVTRKGEGKKGALLTHSSKRPQISPVAVWRLCFDDTCMMIVWQAFVFVNGSEQSVRRSKRASKGGRTGVTRIRLCHTLQIRSLP